MPRVSWMIVVIVMMVAPGMAGIAAANHRTVAEAGLDDDVARTSEDDGARFHAPGSALDGFANRVVLGGGTPGDGALFLDSRAASTVGAGAAPGPDLFLGTFQESVLGRRDVLLPGERHVSAWYGAWSDFNHDGIIGDIHDAGCGGTACPGDEFVWRGIGSGVSTTILHFDNPNEFTYFEPVDAWTHYGTDRNSEVAFQFADETSRENPEQGWTGVFRIRVDGGFLETVQTLAIANAPAAIGTPWGYNVNDPGTLRDVDEYEAVNPELGALWSSSIGFGRGTWNEVDPFQVTEYVDLVLRTVIDAEFLVFGIIYGETPDPVLTPRDPREPSTAEDDYEDRAQFGGVGDTLGSHNTYAGYKDGYHLYMDNLFRGENCPGAYAVVPGTGTKYEGHPVYQCAFTLYDPVSANTHRERTSTVMLSFYAYVYLWYDRNGDNHMGDMCDPTDPDEYDMEAGHCQPDRLPDSWPHSPTGGEAIGICGSSSIRDSVVTVTPVGADWPDAVVVRDHWYLSRAAAEDGFEVPEGSEEVALRWQDSCRSAIRTRDALYFPTPPTMPLRVETRAAIDGYFDATNGVDIGPEYVVDVDILPPWM